MDPTERPPFAVPWEEPATPVVPRDSATVIVARDGVSGPEVFMLERHLSSDFLGGAYVFPGGTLDKADRDPALADLVDGIGEDLRRALGDLAPGLVVCAIRETFEEAGILLARHADGTPVRLTGDARWAEYRRALNAREMTALELARATNVRFAGDLLRFWSRLVTPVPVPKRYDTRFFVAHMPDGQEPLHDDVETTASVWIRPDDAVEDGRAGRFAIIFPTRITLEAVGAFASAAELFAAATGRPADDVTPRIVMRDGEAKIELPDGTVHIP